jgi:hypothetical protein
MPNWCSNHIIINGTKENMKPIVDFFNNHNDLNIMATLVPPDEDYDKIVETGNYLLFPHSTFYGTKWDFTKEELNLVDVNEDGVSLSVDTAWAPCNEFLRRLCIKYKVNAENEYEEPGCDFAGRYTCDAEGNQNDESYPWLEGVYKFDNDLFWMRIDDDEFAHIDSIEQLKEEYSFLDEQDMEELIKIYNTNKGE